MPLATPDLILSNSLMSAPETNVRPAPIKTAAFTVPSSLICSIDGRIVDGDDGDAAEVSELNQFAHS